MNKIFSNFLSSNLLNNSILSLVLVIEKYNLLKEAYEILIAYNVII